MMDPVWQSSSTFDVMRQAMTAQPAEGTFAASEVHKNVWLGNVAAARDLTGLRDRGIRGVVNVTENEPNNFEGVEGVRAEDAGSNSGGGSGGVFGGGGIRYLAVRVADSDGVDLLGHFEKVCAFMDAILVGDEGEGEPAIGNGSKPGPAVLVHCTAGVSRSAACVAAYLMKTIGLTRDACLEKIRRSRLVARPNDGFMRQLSQWRVLLDDEARRQRAAPPHRLALTGGTRATTNDGSDATDVNVEDATATMMDVVEAVGDGVDDAVGRNHEVDADRLDMYTSSLRVAPNQVAGHSSKGVGLPSLVDVVAGHFLKPCPDDRKGTAEVEFYRRVAASVRDGEDPSKSFAGFAPYVPAYMGTFRVDAAGIAAVAGDDPTAAAARYAAAAGESATFLRLEDVTAGYSKPCVIDLKVGLRTYSQRGHSQAYIAKRCVHDERSGQAEVGFKVCGMQTWERQGCRGDRDRDQDRDRDEDGDSGTRTSSADCSVTGSPSEFGDFDAAAAAAASSDCLPIQASSVAMDEVAAAADWGGGGGGKGSGGGGGGGGAKGGVLIGDGVFDHGDGWLQRRRPYAWARNLCTKEHVRCALEEFVSPPCPPSTTVERHSVPKSGGGGECGDSGGFGGGGRGGCGHCCDVEPTGVVVKLPSSSSAVPSEDGSFVSVIDENHLGAAIGCNDDNDRCGDRCGYRCGDASTAEAAPGGGTAGVGVAFGWCGGDERSPAPTRSTPTPAKSPALQQQQQKLQYQQQKLQCQQQQLLYRQQHQSRAAEVFGEAIEHLRGLRRWFATQREVHLLGSSVLIVYEGDDDVAAAAAAARSRNRRSVRVCVVDFCNYVAGCGELDDNFGAGLDRMVEMLSDIIAGASDSGYVKAR